MICQMIVGVLLGILPAMAGCYVFDMDNPKKTLIAWGVIIVGNLVMSILVGVYDLP
jgi:hypothetical protein